MTCPKCGGVVPQRSIDCPSCNASIIDDGAGKQEMSQDPPAISQEAPGFLRHPLVLLLIGVIATSTATSILVPFISARANRQTLLQETTLRKAIEIRNKNATLNGELNSFLTRLMMFHQDNIRLRPSPADLRLLQLRLSEDMNARYLEFDKTAWWWHKDIYEEARLLEVLPSEESENAKNLKVKLDEYKENLRNTVNVLSEFWHTCLCQDYDIQENGKTSNIQISSKKKFDDLAEAREALINQIVLYVTEKQ